MNHQHRKNNITVILARKGHGKTTLSNRLSEKYKRKIIFDPAGEHSGHDYVYTAKDFFAFIRKYPSRSVIIKINPNTGTLDDIQDAFEDIMNFHFKTGVEKPHGESVFIVEEAQVFFPQLPTNDIQKRIIFMSRHAEINIIANSQRPSIVSKDLLSQADDVYLGQILIWNDVKANKQNFGEKGGDTQSLPKGSFLHFEGGGFLKEFNIFKDATNQNKL